MKKLIMLMILGGLAFGGWQANLRWEEFKPVLAELEERHPEKYAQMVAEAKSFHIKETKRLYHEIESMTREEVINLRYEKWQEKRQADKEFNEKYYDDELLNRIEVKKALLKDYQSRMDEIRKLNERQPVKVRFEQWKKTEPWKQKLILHEKCVKYVKMEIKDREVFRRGLEISKVSTLMARLSNKPFPVELLCNDLVPVAKSPQKIQEAIQRLKATLTFNYYIRLLEEVGIPKKEIFLFNDELKGRARNFTDS
jgi:hypothetical protein|tara:strand:+ start:1803 stop:2564 length:762 start_codon:yes stop_codon:yes gene_type:complete